MIYGYMTCGSGSGTSHWDLGTWIWQSCTGWSTAVHDLSNVTGRIWDFGASPIGCTASEDMFRYALLYSDLQYKFSYVRHHIKTFKTQV
jgi:hypothetical protein